MKNDEGRTPADTAQKKLNGLHIRDKNIVLRLRGAAFLYAALDGDAELNAKDDDGNTPLHWAGSLGHTAGIAALVDAGADPYGRNGWGQTPLHTAAGEGHAAAVTALLDAGADPYGKDIRGNNPLSWAKAKRRPKVMAILRGAMGQ